MNNFFNEFPIENKHLYIRYVLNGKQDYIEYVDDDPECENEFIHVTYNPNSKPLPNSYYIKNITKVTISDDNHIIAYYTFDKGISISTNRDTHNIYIQFA